MIKYKTSFANLLRLCVFSALAMEFHEKLQSLAAKEGLRGRKVSRALESFSWNITILKVSNTHSLIHSQKPKQPQEKTIRTCFGL